MLLMAMDTCAFGGVTFGLTDAYGAELYLLDLDGWGAPQSTVQATQKAAGDGAFGSPAYMQPRVFTVSTAIVAPTRPELVAALDRVTGAASINQQPVTVTNGGAVRFATAQRQGEITVRETSPVSVEVTLQFLAVDPRKFAAALTTSTLLPSSSGGLTVPFTVPFTINSTVVTGQCSLTNPGNAPGRTILRIDGPVAGPVITHVASGATLFLASTYTLPAGSWLTIDMDNHTVLENDTADRSTFVTTRGWSQFEPGSNTWTFAAATYNASTRLTVTGYPAWW